MTRQRRRPGARLGGLTDDLSPLTDQLAGVTAALEPAERLVLAKTIATDLRDANAKRIKGNVQPDEEAMAARKPQAPKHGVRTIPLRAGSAKAAARRTLMFQKASQPQYLKKEATALGAQVGFAGSMARIMRVHQEGLRDHVTRDPASPEVTYPKREVLGLAPGDRVRLLAQVEAALL